MRPLRVSCRLQDGCIVSTDGLFPLDSILAAQWMRRHRPDLFYNDGVKAESCEPDLPLARVRIGGQEIFAASVAQYVSVGEYVHRWHKRLDETIVGRYVDRPGRVHTGSGPYKGYRMPLVVILAPRLTWFCVGEPDGVRELLSDCLALGKKRSQGFGMVALDAAGRPGWTVEEWSEDWSVRGPGGRLMRPVPLDLEAGLPAHGARVMRWGIRPPYWHPPNQVLCELPEVGDWEP